jgi:pyruvate dehydrogenase E1 component alpha subunit
VNPTSDFTGEKREIMSPPKRDASHRDAPVNKKLSKDEKIQLYRQLVRIRRFEQAALQQYQKGKMGGFLHLYIGQEATAVGTISLMEENDHVITAYRDHGHALAVGMGMNECMAELFGKHTGCSKGKGGSMHFFAPDKNYWGGHGIVAGQTPLGAGIAFALKYQDLKGCCLCFLGDGAINQGAFHESLNLVSLWNLPAVYIIENNGYSMGTSVWRSSAHPPEGLAARADAYNMEWDIVNGEDLYEIRAKTQIAMQRARDELRPTLLEIATYRYYGHSIADANHQKYRTKEEIEKYKRIHDPILVWRDALLEEKVASEDELKAIDTAAKDEAAAAVEFAENSPFPPKEEIFTDVYWEVDNNTESGQTGRHFFND